MAIAPAPNIGSQLERAVMAYLWEIWPVNVMPRPNFYFSNDWKQRVVTPGGLLDVFAFHSTESPTHTRDESFQVRLQAKWPGGNQPGQVNQDFHWTQINNLIGIPHAAMSVTDNNGDDYRATAMKISAAGRRLAVFGIPWNAVTLNNNLANNADMVDFICDYVQFQSSVRAEQGDTGIILVEKKNYMLRAYNNADDSIFPKLSFGGSGFSWAFTPGGISAENPIGWTIQNSPDGNIWTTYRGMDGADRGMDYSDAGTAYWRVCRTDADGNLLDPESNVIQVTI